jgi:hypothetical protein
MASSTPARGRRDRLPTNVCGERVRMALMEARPAGLSPYQVRKGILWIKEVAAREHVTPLIYTPKGGYRFPLRRLGGL